MSNLLQLYKSEEASDPFEKIVFKLPNFMFLLSHLYLNNCYNEVSTAMIVSILKTEILNYVSNFLFFVILWYFMVFIFVQVGALL